MTTGTAEAAVDAFDAAVDGLLAAELSSVDGVRLAEIVRRVEANRRRLEAVDQRLLAEVDERGLAGEYARCSTVDLLVTTLRVDPREAKARVVRAAELGPRRELTGAALDPVLPEVAAAVAVGEISAGHVQVISRCLDRIPGELSAAATPVAEAMLVEAARHEHPGALARTAALLLARLDPDGAGPREEDLQRRRGFTLVKDADGSGEVRGHWTPELVAAWDAIFDSLAAPVPAEDGMPDDRTPAQRRHDALLDAANRLLRSGSLPAAGGMPTTVLVTTTAQDLAAGHGIARTAHGDLWPVHRLLHCSSCPGDSALVNVHMDDHGAPLWLGRTRRLATPAQRLAMTARDGGCSFPGCERPPAWCEAHHVNEWDALGPTDIDNMCLLCSFHHRSFEKRGWAVEMINGLPWWRPPRWVDPEQTPIRNTAHHIPDFDFAVVAA